MDIAILREAVEGAILLAGIAGAFVGGVVRGRAGRAPEEPAPPRSPTGSHAALLPRVLVVEDEPSYARILARTLRAEGYAVDVAHSAAEARALAVAHAYVAHVLDLSLPGSSGDALATALLPRQIIYTGAAEEIVERLRDRGWIVVEKSSDVGPLIDALRRPP